MKKWKVRISGLHVFWLAATIYGYVQRIYLPDDWLAYAKGIILILPVMTGIYVQMRGRHLISCLFLMVAVTGITGVSGEPGQQQIVLLLLCGLILISCLTGRLRGGGWTDRPHAGYGLLFAVLYILSSVYGWREAGTMLYYHAGIYLLICIVSDYIERMLDYEEENKEMQRFPANTIRGLGRFYLAGSLLSGVGIVLLIPIGTYEGLRKIIGNMSRRLVAAAGAVISWIFSLFPERTAAEELAVSEQVREEAVFLEETAETSALMQALEQIMTVVVTIAAGAMVLFLAGYGLYCLWRRFYQVPENEYDQTQAVKTEEKEKYREKRPQKGRLRGGAPDIQIRRMYRRVIIKGKAEPSVYATPEELESGAGIQDRETQPTVHMLYEKARYAGKPCTKEELAQMKAVVKKINRHRH